MNANEILKKHEDANEMHFHEVDREWIIEAMEEYAEQFRLFDFSDTVLPNIKIEIKDKNVNITTNSIEHDDVVMFWLIESIYALRNKQYSKFRQK